MTPLKLVSVMGAIVICVTTYVLVSGAPAEAQAPTDQRTCELDGRHYLPGDRACITGFVNLCNGETGEWDATDTSCDS